MHALGARRAHHAGELTQQLGSSFPPSFLRSAQLYAACSVATTGALTMRTRATPQHGVKRGKLARYTVKLTRTATKGKTSAATTGSAPTMGLRIYLPAGVRYTRSSVFKLPRVNGMYPNITGPVQPPVDLDARTLTWSHIGMSASGLGGPVSRKVKVSVRVDNTVPVGSVLQFMAELFEEVRVGNVGLPACRRTSNATVKVI